ncbi:hypothetical protein CC1G_06298 [Coprinopsis cinerea okayama7|uniref:SH3 domain-containing protein n=1 Tax=Coprinopsis cinerea (strain Okayama-7 / 130 / ATCC MYA-4618 / FGSC 9003) TaxID=240176 RepID=A8NTF1_COPC7|nr:hypothetical protein CC1G_06298 [Coprinopsis cinerea okayama7\|eukprot:XP_001836213.1 hypothetical protein CC1G_06298 [Coprinopsis cinerea okayama7\
MTGPPDAALDFILSQTKQNVQYLLARKAMGEKDGEDILFKLTCSQSALAMAPTDEVQNRGPSFQGERNSFSSEKKERGTEQGSRLRPSVPAPPTPCLFRAKAIWGYNEDNKEPNDLSFREGDIVDIISETNADWWTGRYNGKTGLFPSAYVSRVPNGPPVVPGNSPAHMGGPRYPPGIRPYPPATPTYTAPPYPPPAQPPYNPPNNSPAYVNPGPPAPLPSQQQLPPMQPNEPKKQSLGGTFGNTLAQAAAGGIGFGAGNAVGSGIIHAIF